MYRTIEVILKRIRPYSSYILIFLIVVIFIAAAIYAYNKFAKASIPKLSGNKNTNVANADSSSEKTSDIFFFHADWCPHCRKAMPEWKSFQDEYNSKVINGYKIVCHDIDCTADNKDQSDPNVEKYVQLYGINSYPTVKMTLSDGETVDFDAKISKSSLVQFVETILS